MQILFIHTHTHTYIYIYISSSSSLVARISLTLSRHSSLSFIALGRSSGQHPVSSHSCWMYVRAGRPAFARPCVGVHKSTSPTSSSLLLQQCPACLARLTWIVFMIGGRWPYSWCLMGCCCQDLFKIARCIRQVLFSFRLSLDLVFWSWFGDLLVSENPIGFYASDSLGRIVHIPFGFMVKFKFLARFHADYLSHPVVSRIILFCINFHCYHSNLLFENLSLKYEWQQVSSSLELLSVFLLFSKML